MLPNIVCFYIDCQGDMSRLFSHLSPSHCWDRVQHPQDPDLESVAVTESGWIPVASAWHSVTYQRRNCQH